MTFVESLRGLRVLWWRLSGILVRPHRVLSEVVETPDLLLPLFLLLLSQVVMIGSTSSVWSQVLQSAGVGVQPVQGVERSRVLTMAVACVVFAVTALVTLLSIIANGVMLWILAKPCRFGGDIRSFVAVFAYSRIPLAIRNVVLGLWFFFSDVRPRAMSPGGEEAPLSTLAWSGWPADWAWLDPFTVWSYILVGIGIARIPDASSWHALFVALTFAVINLVVEHGFELVAL